MKIRRILRCSHYACSLVFTSILLSACAAPYPKASYELIQSQNPEVEILSSPKLTGWAKFKGCYISFDAKSKDDGFEFSLRQKYLGPVCTYNFDQGPIVIEAAGSDTRYEIDVFHRIKPAVLSIDEEVDLASISPGFIAVPEHLRQYALSFAVQQQFAQTSLPETFDIRIPEILHRDQNIVPPLFRFKRYKKSGVGWWYAPLDSKTIERTKPV